VNPCIGSILSTLDDDDDDDDDNDDDDNNNNNNYDDNNNNDNNDNNNDDYNNNDNNNDDDNTLITGLASCLVLISIAVTSSLITLGHNSALPFLGLTAIFKVGKLVSPPSSTSDRYKKNVSIRGPHARALSSLPKS
jgi:hypothetical protein